MLGIRKISQTGVGSSPIYVYNYLLEPSSISVQIVVTGTATYTLEVTLDDVSDISFNPSTANWFGFFSGTTNSTVSQNNSSNFPYRGIRVTISSGTGTVEVTILQSGIG